MESKSGGPRMVKLHLECGYMFGFTVDAEGLSGGLGLWWNFNVKVEILSATKNMIDTIVTNASDSSLARVSWVYGPPHYRDKARFWDSLDRFSWNNNTPWLCTGDFNELLWQHEKSGGNPILHSTPRCLQRFMDSNSLLDLGYIGQRFTWQNNHVDGSFIQERIDRGLVNEEWLIAWPESQVYHCPMMGSDHCPILVETSSRIIAGPKPFRFEAVWAEDPECESMVQQGWDLASNGDNLSRWVLSLKSCELKLRKWSKLKFKDRRFQIDFLYGELKGLQNFMEDADVRVHADTIISSIDSLWELEEIFWHQRSRVKWLTSGDSNSRFFHISTLQRRQYNRILRLKSLSGNWLVTEPSIHLAFDDYFRNLFKTVGPRDWSKVLLCTPSIVSADMNDSLTRPLSLDEVQAAAAQLGSLKAPGPDGFPGLFYQRYWSTVSSVVNDSASDFFNFGHQIVNLNMTHIVLIPKILHPEELGQFRPISLCNNSYKLLAKILANRLKVILPNIISSHQNAFVPHRQIQDNVLLAHEAFHHLRLKKSICKFELGLKLDMNKAYDRIEWDFLQAMMYKMGFNDQWVSLIMRCVSSVSFAVMLNGKVGSQFCPSRGLRQGDPLSPYLFLLVSEALSNMISYNSSLGQLQGIYLHNRCPMLTHLFFADDSIFFLAATNHNCVVMEEILFDYCLASGQLINLDKSNIFFSPNTPLWVRKDLCWIFGIKEADNPGNYLGLPTIWGRSKKEALNYIKERILGKVQGWKQKHLSQAGKETLIKAVLFAIPSYPMSCFKLPITLCREIDSLIANFWWGNNSVGGNKIHWKRWELMGLSKAAGGMGFKNLGYFNDAMLARQAWRIICNPGALWVQILKGLYFPNCSFLEAQKGGRASWAWSSILVGRDIILSGAHWQILNGSSTSIWADKWIPGIPGGYLRPCLPVPVDAPVKVCELIDWNHGVWNLLPIAHLISQHELHAISAIPIGESVSGDRLVWPWVKSGNFTVKSGYNWIVNQNIRCPLAHAQSSHTISLDTWKIIWESKTLPKVKQFLWRAVSNILPSFLNLYKRRLSTSHLCPICLESPESIEHMLVLCPWTACVWFGSAIGYRVDLQNFTSLDRWLGSLLRGESMFSPNSRWILSVVAFTCWHIWKARCKFVYNDIPIVPAATRSHACLAVSEFWNVTKKPVLGSVGMPIQISSPHPSHWLPPISSYVKINTDGSWKSGSAMAGVGVIIRKIAGSCIGGLAAQVRAQSPLMAEVLALKHGLLRAKELNLVNVVVESDSQVAINSVLGDVSSSNWELYPILKDIRFLKASFTNLNWAWVPREANRSADAVASLARKGMCLESWLCDLHPL
ncbi:hypothetical protein L3X38_015758 [Prunus dulcis]|uniref:Reverse transcriptase domain-containing protein n=1 Tax=Prunus dulcis TaxID=3755 RepID=A0AAD4Z859_PRUDU|nr:hypothetical protein L3X38_015758 [Prunus dulcis]